MDEDSDRQNQQQDKESNLTARGKNNFYSSNKTEFKNYVFQFLMVLLEITVGFFVENIRENYVESKKLKNMRVHYSKVLIQILLICIKP
jgi:hypothetical protein